MTLRLRKFNASDEGLTLVEILLAIVITAVIGVVIVKTTISSSAALTRTSREVNTNLQVMNFSRTLRYDIAGATDVYVFANPPSTIQRVCGSAGIDSLKWQLSNSGDARTLFTVRVNELIDPGYIPSSDSKPTYIERATGKWYGYEIRRPRAKQNFELWRVACDETNGAPNSRASWVGNEMLMVELGRIDTQTSFGQNLLKCFPAESQSSCPVDSSTASKSYYQFTLPYFVLGYDTSSEKQLSAKLYSNYAGNNDLLKTLKRRIEK
jgi:type II secretory pathway pseudopilin PulG